VSCPSPLALSDAELVASFLQGDDGTAWATLYARHAWPLVCYLMSHGATSHDAQDAAHDAWLVVFTWKALRPGASLLALLRVVGKRTLAEGRRRMRVHLANIVDLEAQGGKPSGARSCAYCDERVSSHGLCKAHAARRARGVTQMQMIAPVRKRTSKETT